MFIIATSAQLFFCLQRDGRHQYSKITVAVCLGLSRMYNRTTACVNVIYLEQKTIPGVTFSGIVFPLVIAVEDLLDYEQLH